MDKERIDLYIILVLLIGLLIIGGLAVATEHKYNQMVVKYNDCQANKTARFNHNIKAVYDEVFKNG